MNDTASPHATVAELIRLREQLTAWIAKLDEVGPQASSRVAERVRADYQDRLRRVTEDLGAHREEIEADLERFREAHGEAETRRAAAAEALEEARLRHLIGELDDAAWEDARPELERDVAGAEDAVAHARAEVERLEALSADVAGAADPAAPIEVVWTPEAEAQEAEETPEAEPAPAAEAAEEEPPAPVAEAEPAAEPAAAEPPPEPRHDADAVSADAWDPFGGEFGGEARQGDAGEDLPWLAAGEETTEWTPPAEESGLEFLRGIDEPAPPAAAGESAADLGEDDLAFLEELDRSIGGAGARPPSSAAPQPPRPAPSEPTPTPAPGSRAEPLLCKECGAINEPHSWYCEICGSEL